MVLVSFYPAFNFDDKGGRSVKKNWRLSSGFQFTILATIDGQFITLSVYLCVQQDAREAARRAGPSATNRL